MSNPSKEEIELLLATVRSVNRQVWTMSSNVGEYVDVGGIGYPDPNKYDARVAAIYVDAVGNMYRRGWLKLVSQGETTIYQVTAEGYKAADELGDASTNRD